MPLAVIEQGRFAGRSQRDETADLLAQVALSKPLQRINVDLSVLERRDNRQPYSRHHAQLRCARRPAARERLGWFAAFDTAAGRDV
jgi:hypothetical protein